MTENFKNKFDKGKCAGVLLMDLSKAFDITDYILLIAKLEAYGFFIFNFQILKKLLR